MLNTYPAPVSTPFDPSFGDDDSVRQALARTLRKPGGQPPVMPGQSPYANAMAQNGPVAPPMPAPAGSAPIVGLDIPDPRVAPTPAPAPAAAPNSGFAPTGGWSTGIAPVSNAPPMNEPRGQGAPPPMKISKGDMAAGRGPMLPSGPAASGPAAPGTPGDLQTLSPHYKEGLEAARAMALMMGNVASTPLPASPFEERLAAGGPAIAVTRGNQTTYAQPEGLEPGIMGAVPEYATPPSARLMAYNRYVAGQERGRNAILQALLNYPHLASSGIEMGKLGLEGRRLDLEEKKVNMPWDRQLRRYKNIEDYMDKHPGESRANAIAYADRLESAYDAAAGDNGGTTQPGQQDKNPGKTQPLNTPTDPDVAMSRLDPDTFAALQPMYAPDATGKLTTDPIQFMTKLLGRQNKAWVMSHWDTIGPWMKAHYGWQVMHDAPRANFAGKIMMAPGLIGPILSGAQGETVKNQYERGVGATMRGFWNNMVGDPMPADLAAQEALLQLTSRPLP